MSKPRQSFQLFLHCFFLCLVIVVMFPVMTSSGQPDKFTKKILGSWTVSEKDRPSNRKEVIIEIVRDTIRLLSEDEYGNYQESEWKFSSSPSKSGPKGLLFEKDSVYVDEYGDTIDVSMWMKYENIDKSPVGLNLGQMKRLRTNKYGSSDTWSSEVREILNDKIRSLLNNGSFSVDMTMMRSRKR